MKKNRLMAAVLALMLVLTACAGVPGETTSDPVPTPEASVETTVPVETTAPVETTVPAETTVPMETTEPPALAETNALRQFILPPNTSGDGEFSNFVYDSPYSRDQIKSITIVDTLADAPEETWDASEARNGAVLCWVEPNGELYDLYIGAEGGVWAGSSARNMFRGYTNAERIDFGHAFYTEDAEDMYGMFLSCVSLRELDLSHFDTSWVLTMECMFAGCHALERVEFGDFYTGITERMDHMFDGCRSLTALDLSGFDTASVNNMACMFNNCESLTSLDLSSFYTSNLTMMSSMFAGCRSLTELDVRNFDTSKVMDTSYLFMDCESLTELELSHFDMSSVSGDYCTYKMFHNCPAGSEWKHLQK